MRTNSNPYCQKLGIAVPRVEDAMQRPGVKLFHLMVVTLLERGQPVELREIAARLDVAGADSPVGDLELSLKKAWHGLQPVYRLPDGRYGLVLGSFELAHILRAVGLREPYPQPALPAPAPASGPESPDGDAPLELEELTEALRATRPPHLSELRLAAAVIDACHGPKTLMEVNAELERLAGPSFRIYAANPKYWRGRLLSVDDAGRLHLLPGTTEAQQMRRTIRAVVLTARRERQLEEQRQAAWKAREATLAEEERRAASVAAQLRRAVLRVVPEPDSPRAVAVLDESAHTVRTFVGAEVESLPVVLGTFDLVAGLHVRDTLHALGLDPDRWRLVDLKPPQKTRRLNRSGRLLHITPDLLIVGSTWISRPLGDPARTATYLESSRSLERLRRRLESDVKALHALYRYGVLHRCVWLRWGFLDELLSVDWAQPGEPHLRTFLRDAAARGAPLDVVVGTAPGWNDPWSRARRVRAVARGDWEFDCTFEDDSTPVDLRAVQAVRPAVGVVVEGSTARRKRAARLDQHRPRSGQQHSGRRQKSDRPVKPRWIFAARFGHRLGWRSQPAVQKVRDAVSEIVKVARRDPTRAADGAVLFFEKVAPALEHVDGSSGAIGMAVNRAVDALVPIIVRAPLRPEIRGALLERLWTVICEDGMPYLERLDDWWGELCGDRSVASAWADRLVPTVELSWSSDPKLGGYFRGTTACLSALLAAGRYEELLQLLEKARYAFWPDRQFGVRALLALGRRADALKYAEASERANARSVDVARTCEGILLSSGLREEAYRRYAFQANMGTTNLATYRALVKRYPEKKPATILRDLVAASPGSEGKWFAAAREAGLLEEAIALAMRSPCDPRTLTRAARDHARSHPAFAIEAGIAALHWIAQGYGYEITSDDVWAAYRSTMEAAEAAGQREETRLRIRDLVAGETMPDRFLTRHLGRELSFR